MGKSKSKSSSKSDASAATADATPPSIIAQLQPAADDSSSSKKEKKDKKKDKKRKSSSSSDDGASSENPAAAEPAKKKAKTDSTAAATETPANADGTWTFAEVPAVASMPIADVESYYKEHNMTIEGHEGECFKPLLEFAHAGLPPVVMGALAGFEKPTPIQAASWPIALRTRDLIAIAETGSGKTLGFTIPALVHVRNQLAKAGGKKRAPNAPHVLVVLPTRELAMQVATVTEAAGKACGLKSVCLYGGVPKWEQAKTIAGAHFAVGTPGRLVDLAINDGTLDLSQVSMIVLDEADRMLDLGFEKDIRQLMGAVMDKSKRQTLMFSATWPMGVRKLASEFLVDPVKLTIGDDELAASQTVTQVVEVLKDAQNNPRDKERRLLELLRKYQGNKKSTKVLVFALYKKEAQRLEDCLRRAGYTVEGIHGDKNQGSRTQALQRFRDGVAPVLVATDVAARGLDIPNVEFVINVTFPLTIEDYVHRIGRTGRAGKKGLAHTLFTSHDKAHSGELVNVLKQANQTVPEDLVKFGTTVKRKEHSAYGAFFKEVDANAKGSLVKFDSDDDE